MICLFLLDVLTMVGCFVCVRVCFFMPCDELFFRTELRGMVSYSALKAVCAAGDDVVRQRRALKKLFGSFVKCDKNVVRTQVMTVNLRSSVASLP